MRRPRAIWGWAIPSGATLDRPNADDPGEAEVLYRVLEREVVPLYYQRDARGLPAGWLAMMRASIRRVATEFSARRMVTDYFFEAGRRFSKVAQASCARR